MVMEEIRGSLMGAQDRDFTRLIISKDLGAVLMRKAAVMNQIRTGLASLGPKLCIIDEESSFPESHQTIWKNKRMVLSFLLEV